MSSLSLFRRFVIILVFAQVGFAVAGRKPKHIQPSMEDAQKIITDRIRSANPEQLEKGKEQAAKRLQSNFAKAMMAMSSKRAREIPMEIREEAKAIVAATKAGQLNDAVVMSLQNILSNAPNKPNPAQQLNSIVNGILPNAPADLQAPLQGVMDFVKANMAGVNNVLNRLVSGTPNLLQGVVGSLANTLGGVNMALNGSMDSLNNLVGGLLSGGVAGGLLNGGAGGLLSGR